MALNPSDVHQTVVLFSLILMVWFHSWFQFVCDMCLYPTGMPPKVVVCGGWVCASVVRLDCESPVVRCSRPVVSVFVVVVVVVVVVVSLPGHFCPSLGAAACSLPVPYAPPFPLVIVGVLVGLPGSAGAGH